MITRWAGVLRDRYGEEEVLPNVGVMGGKKKQL